MSMLLQLLPLDLESDPSNKIKIHTNLLFFYSYINIYVYIIIEEREERKRKAYTKAQWTGGWILETQGKGTTPRRMESLDILTCRKADHLKKKKKKI